MHRIEEDITMLFAGHMVQWIKCWSESASEWNYQEVPGSIPLIGKITKNTYNSLTLVPTHGKWNQNNLFVWIE